MNKLSLGNENEKNKETKETSEAESYEDYDALQNAEEGMEEGWLSENGMPPFALQSPKPLSESECETFESSLKNSYEERKEQLLREKWFTVTGKRPRNIPYVKGVLDESRIGFSYFGERRPAEVEKRRHERMTAAVKKMQALGIQHGKIRQEIPLRSLNQGLMCVKFSTDGNLLAFSERNGSIEIWRVSTNKLVVRPKVQEQTLTLPIRSLVFHPKNSEKLYTGGDCGVIRAFDATSGVLLEDNDGFDLINVMDFNVDGDYIATGGRRGSLHVVDANTLQCLWTRGCQDLDGSLEPSIYDDYHRMRIYALKFHPTEPYLFVTGGWDNVAKIWDVRIPKAIRSFCGPSIYGTGVDISENIVLTASWRAENSLSLWDFPTGTLIKNFPLNNKSIQMEGEFLYTAKFFKNHPPLVSNSMIAVGGSGFPEMLIINVFTEKIEKYFPSYKATLTLDIFQNLVAYGGKESILRIAEITPQPGRPTKFGIQSVQF